MLPKSITEELALIANRCASMKWMHDQSSKHLKKVNTYLSISVILATGLTGTAIFSTMNDADVQFAMNIVSGVCLYLSSAITGIQQTVNYESRASKHQAAAKKYSQVYHDIRMMFLEDQDTFGINDFYQKVTQTLDAFETTTPEVPWWIRQKFKQKFPARIVETIETEVSNVSVAHQDTLAHQDTIGHQDTVISMLPMQETSARRYQMERFANHDLCKYMESP